MGKPLRVLVLNVDYPPDSTDTARVVQEMAQTFARKHLVTVLAGRPFYDPSQRHPYYPFRQERLGNLTVERVGSTAFNRRRMLGRVSNYVSYLTLSFLRALMAPADLVIAMTDPPLAGLVGALVATLRRKPFLYNIRDLHPDMAVASGFVRPGAVVWLWDRMHRWVLGRADLIVVLGEDMRERLIQKGVPPQRVAVVRNGAPLTEPVGAGPHPTIDLVRGGFPFSVLHAGNLGHAGAWDTILEAASRLRDEPVGFVFIGDGASRQRLERLASNLPNVRFMPFRPPEEIPLVLAAPDLHVVTIRRGLEGLLLPGKLYPILAAGRPVLAITPEASDVARIIREYECGLVADPDDPESVASAVFWASTHPEEVKGMGQRARQAARNFDRAVLLQQFVDLSEKVAGGTIDGAAGRQYRTN